MSFSYKNILIINTFGIGDVLFTTPLVTNIKRKSPKTRIGYIVNKRTADILWNNPQVDEVFVYERDEFNALYRRSKTAFLKKVRALIKEIKMRRYDAVLDLSMNTAAGFFMMLAGIRTRIGFDYKGRGRFLTQKIPLSGYEGRHVVLFYLDLLRYLGVDPQECPMIFPPAREAQERVSDLLQQHGLTGCVIVIVPGGGASWGRDAPRKHWSAEKFAQMADRLVKSCGAKIILAGGPKDKKISREIQYKMTAAAVDLTGELSPEESVALFQKGHLVVTNDGGPLHMAAAAGARTVSIFGPVDEHVYGPYPPQGHRTVSLDIACRPCYRRFRVAQCDHISCLRDLSVDRVFEAVQESLA